MYWEGGGGAKAYFWKFYYVKFLVLNFPGKGIRTHIALYCVKLLMINFRRGGGDGPLSMYEQGMSHNVIRMNVTVAKVKERCYYHYHFVIATLHSRFRNFALDISKLLLFSIFTTLAWMVRLTIYIQLKELNAKP